MKHLPILAALSVLTGAFLFLFHALWPVVFIVAATILAGFLYLMDWTAARAFEKSLKTKPTTKGDS